jgi:PEP-CTERM motif
LLQSGTRHAANLVFATAAISLSASAAWAATGGLTDGGIDLTLGLPPILSIPEPASLALFGAGLVVFGLIRLRRRKR